MRIPTATYRIQFTPEFGFREARTLIEYLKLLGISDIYASPIFHARPGSTHGYDIVDGGSLNPELGSQDDFLALSTALKQAGMGWLQDIVPNHRAFDANNSKLNALLESGPDSRYGDMFDIDWEHHAEGLNSKLLAPFLGRHYGVALEAGEIRLNYSEQGFFISYFDLQFPLRIESYATVLTHCVAELRCRRHEDSPGYTQLLGILYALKFLDDQKSHQKRAAEVTFIKQNLWNLYHNGGPVKKALDSSIHTINGQPGEVNSFNSLDGLLQKQWFRLAFWKVANEEINYRRFFFINDLICLRAENEETFNSTHEMPLQLYKQGHCTGFRIDHIDGLYDPHTYLQRLRQKAPKAYLIVEKILSHKEQAPAWMGQGTTGYDFLNMINGIFCHSGNEQEFTRLYHNYSRVRRSCSELLRDKKKLIIEKHMHGDLENLSHELKRIAVYSRYGSDLTLEGIRRALREVLCLFPAYRTYLSPSEERPEDRECLKKVIHQADRLNPDMANELKFIRSVLLPQAPGAADNEQDTQRLHFAMRLQQMCSAITAKGLEDTLCYVYNRLLSLNEVGGDPAHFGVPLSTFHDFNRQRLRNWPHSLSATATHDTKRGEDVRARLNVLSEIPGEWASQIKQWSRLNRGHKKRLGENRIPDKNDEYFLYQTLIGTFPDANEDRSQFLERLNNYLVKAIREAKIHTAWLKPDSDYENGLLEFVQQVLTPPTGLPFLEEFLPFQRKIAHFGRFNALSQTLSKITAPGVPDIYQGTEFWDLNMLDPDNRRAVDFSRRADLLRQLQQQRESDLQALLVDLRKNAEDGRIKLFLLQRALQVRTNHVQLFQTGTYIPISATGPASAHVIAFGRCTPEQAAITVVPRFLAAWLQSDQWPLGEALWSDTMLDLSLVAKGVWQNVLTGEDLPSADSIPVGSILRHFPVALLLLRN